jgi:pimeloyl-ACP methyl ester carboxylesterase
MTHRVRLGAGEFSYRRAGSPGAEPVVLLHAMGQESTTWEYVTAALASSFEVFALDQRGHGKSCRPPHYSFEAMREDLEDFGDAIGLDRFNLVGHSLGATVAILFAERHPERVMRLVLEDTPPPSGVEQVDEPEDPPAEPVPFDWAALAPIVIQLNRPDPAWWGDLALISAPTLVIGGGTESFISQEELADTARRIPNAELVTIDAGHHVHRNRPDDFLAALLPFLARPV